MFDFHLQGCTCDEVCNASTCASNTSVGLVSEIGTAHMMLHVGDFGYNLGSNDGTTGDNFFKNIEQIAAYVPYMVSIGNHENSAISLAHYTERFRLMPSNSIPPTITTIATGAGNPPAPNNWYYSWDDGTSGFGTDIFILAALRWTCVGIRGRRVLLPCPLCAYLWPTRCWF